MKFAILSAILFGGIVIIASSAKEARDAKEKCDAYLRDIRERSK